MTSLTDQPPKRILHVVGRMDRAGAETMLMNYFRAIDRDRYQFDFLVFSDDRGDYYDEIEDLGGRIISIVSSNWISRTIAMIRVFRSANWVCIHSHTNSSNMFSLFAAYTARIPIRVSHAHVTGYLEKSWLRRMYHRISRAAISKFSTQKLACGELAAQLLYNPDDAVTIVPNAIKAESFNRDRSEVGPRVRQDMCIAPETTIILQVGRLDVVKNQEFTLDIAKELRKRRENFVVLLVGRGMLEEKLQKEITANALERKVKLLGVRDDIAELMLAADFLILPSLLEGFPVVLVEAQAAGTMCLVSDHVSSEVDLGLNLIKFLSIPTKHTSDEIDKCANMWANSLDEKSNMPPPSEEQRQKLLDARGYSVTSATEKLTQFYEAK